MLPAFWEGLLQHTVLYHAREVGRSLTICRRGQACLFTANSLKKSHLRPPLMSSQGDAP